MSAIEVLAQIFERAGFNRFRMDGSVVVAYANYLSDIDPRLVDRACLNLGATARWLPSPQDIRTECGKIAGIGVTPPADRVWDELINQALYERRVLNEGERGEGPPLHPVSRRLFGMLGADDILSGGATVRAQFRDFYADLAARYNENRAGRNSPALSMVDVDALAARGWAPAREIESGS